MHHNEEPMCFNGGPVQPKKPKTKPTKQNNSTPKLYTIETINIPVLQTEPQTSLNNSPWVTQAEKWSPNSNPAVQSDFRGGETIIDYLYYDPTVRNTFHIVTHHMCLL